MNAIGLLKRIPGLILGVGLTVSAWAAPATVEKGTGVYTFDDDVWFDCAGEYVRSIVYAPYTYHQVQTPKGDYVYVELWLQGVTGTLEGLSSGAIWVRTDNVSPLVDRSTGGGMTHYTFKGAFVSETGPTIEVREVFHVSLDANGELRVERDQFNCWLRD